jgi:hypothetical protein
MRAQMRAQMQVQMEAQMAQLRRQLHAEQQANMAQMNAEHQAEMAEFQRQVRQAKERETAAQIALLERNASANVAPNIKDRLEGTTKARIKEWQQLEDRDTAGAIGEWWEGTTDCSNQVNRLRTMARVRATFTHTRTHAHAHA